MYVCMYVCMCVCVCVCVCVCIYIYTVKVSEISTSNLWELLHFVLSYSCSSMYNLMMANMNGLNMYLPAAHHFIVNKFIYLCLWLLDITLYTLIKYTTGMPHLTITFWYFNDAIERRLPCSILRHLIGVSMERLRKMLKSFVQVNQQPMRV